MKCYRYYTVDLDRLEILTTLTFQVIIQDDSNFIGCLAFTYCNLNVPWLEGKWRGGWRTRGEPGLNLPLKTSIGWKKGVLLCIAPLSHVIESLLGLIASRCSHKGDDSLSNFIIFLPD